jgi:hypothetical protein
MLHGNQKTSCPDLRMPERGGGLSRNQYIGFAEQKQNIGEAHCSFILKKRTAAAASKGGLMEAARTPLHMEEEEESL